MTARDQGPGNRSKQDHARPPPPVTPGSSQRQAGDSLLHTNFPAREAERTPGNSAFQGVAQPSTAASSATKGNGTESSTKPGSNILVRFCKGTFSILKACVDRIDRMGEPGPSIPRKGSTGDYWSVDNQRARHTRMVKQIRSKINQ